MKLKYVFIFLGTLFFFFLASYFRFTVKQFMG